MRRRDGLPRPYLEAVDRYFDALLPRLTPLLVSNGGPIIAMQVENEYGSFGNDHAYLAHLVEGMKSRCLDVLLFTSDGPRDECLLEGTSPGILATVNLAFNAAEAFAKLRKYRPDDPLMVMEFGRAGLITGENSIILLKMAATRLIDLCRRWMRFWLLELR